MTMTMTENDLGINVITSDAMGENTIAIVSMTPQQRQEHMSKIANDHIADRERYMLSLIRPAFDKNAKTMGFSHIM